MAETNNSWEALGSPNELQFTVGCNFRDDPEKSKEFLRSAEQIGSETDLLLRGRGCLFDWSLTSLCPEDVWK